MREIKFRAWDDDSETMIYSDNRNKAEYQVNYDFTVNKNGEIVCCWIEDYDDICGYPVTHGGELDNIMRCTGLKDCSGAEIYDGDIVKVSHGIDKFIMTVIYEELRAGFALWDAKEMVYSDIGEYVEDKMMKLGNIYENPELLEGAK